jgi:hypothetical protein
MTPPPHAVRQDSLLRPLIRPSPEYVAFLRAFRNLPQQQREAFVLFRGEKLEPRQVGVAMDCSTAAAINHLAAADKALAAIAVDTFEARAGALLQVYVSLTPPDDLIVGDVGVIARRLGRRKLARVLDRSLAVAILIAVAWIVWRLSKMIII